MGRFQWRVLETANGEHWLMRLWVEPGGAIGNGSCPASIKGTTVDDLKREIEEIQKAFSLPRVRNNKGRYEEIKPQPVQTSRRRTL